MSSPLTVLRPACCAMRIACSPIFCPYSSSASFMASFASSLTRSAPHCLSSFSIAARGRIFSIGMNKNSWLI